MNDEDRAAHPAPMTMDVQMIAMQKVLDLARRLGLHGILILSPKCEVCPGGALHHWRVLTDIGEPDNDEVSKLLAYYADWTRRNPGIEIEELRPQ